MIQGKYHSSISINLKAIILILFIFNKTYNIIFNNTNNNKLSQLK